MYTIDVHKLLNTCGVMRPSDHHLLTALMGNHGVAMI